MLIEHDTEIFSERIKYRERGFFFLIGRTRPGPLSRQWAVDNP